MPVVIRGEVVRGNRLGRKLGFPTANVLPGALPAAEDGVYVAKVRLAEECYRGVANLGVRPSVAGGGERVLEVHIFDFSGDLYGCQIEVELLQRLRGERRFATTAELRSQIEHDAAQAEKYFKQ